MDMNDHLVSLFVNMQVSRVSKSTNSMMKYRNSGGRDPQSVNVWKEQSITDNASSAIVSALRVPQRSSTKSVRISPQVPTLTSVSWWCACACQATGQMAVVGLGGSSAPGAGPKRLGCTSWPPWGPVSWRPAQHLGHVCPRSRRPSVEYLSCSENNIYPQTNR